jgi:hypothetical protein
MTTARRQRGPRNPLPPMLGRPEPVVHRCAMPGCTTESATYSPDVLPKGWDRLDVNRERCRMCRIRRRAA